MDKLFSGKVRWLINIFIILLLGFMLFLATIYNDSLKQLTAKQFNTYTKKVLGEKVVLPEIKAGNPTEQQLALLTQVVIVVRQNMKETVEPFAKQALQIRIGDIINSYSQVQRLAHDTQALRQILMDKLRKLAE